MTVIETAAVTGASTDTIRWYVRNGLLKPRRNPGSGYCALNAVEGLDSAGRPMNALFKLFVVLPGCGVFASAGR